MKILMSLFIFLVAVGSVMCGEIGYNADGGSDVNTWDSRCFCTLIPSTDVTEGGTITKGYLRIGVPTVEFWARLAFYSDNAGDPGSPLAVSDSFLVAADDDDTWQPTGGATISYNFSVSTAYWACMRVNASPLVAVSLNISATGYSFRRDGGLTGNWYDFPTPFQNDDEYANQRQSIYFDYTTESGSKKIMVPR